MDNEVQLTWVKYQMLNYLLTDACLCPGMSKLVTGTTRGRILLFNAKIKGQIVDSHSPIKEHSESNPIAKVAHEVKKSSLIFFRLRQSIDYGSHFYRILIFCDKR